MYVSSPTATTFKRTGRGKKKVCENRTPGRPSLHCETWYSHGSGWYIRIKERLTPWPTAKQAECHGTQSDSSARTALASPGPRSLHS